jgi:hypothetical protein
LNVQNARRHQPLGLRHKPWLDRELAAEPGQQLVAHRRMNIRGDELLELLRRGSGEPDGAHLPGSLGDELDIQLVSVAQIPDEALTRTGGHGLDDDLDPAGAPGGSRLNALGADGEAAVVHEPDRQRQRRQALQVLPAEVLLPVSEVHGLA